MKINPTYLILACAAGLVLCLLAACGPVTPPPPPASTPCAPEDRPCPAERMTLTAAMETQWASTPGYTPLPFATITLIPGDLGWGEVYGKVLDGNTGLPIPDALVTCEHFSYTSPFRCHGVLGTPVDGFYSFGQVFFHDTDRLTLLVEAEGYAPLRFEKAFFTQPGLHMDLRLFPPSDTPGPGLTPLPVCTPPPCPDGGFICDKPDGCPGGCGVTCRSATPTPSAFLMCTAPACPGGDLACAKADGCLGGCGTICLTPTPQ